MINQKTKLKQKIENSYLAPLYTIIQDNIIIVIKI